MDANHNVDPAPASHLNHLPETQEERNIGEEEEEEFVYEEPTHDTPHTSEEGEDEEDFRYTVSPIVETALRSDSPPAVSLSHATQVSTDQLASILAAATLGNISSFQRQFETIIGRTNLTPFTLANEASPRTGFTALHVASSKGHLDIVKWRKLLLCFASFCQFVSFFSCRRLWCNGGFRG